MDEAKVLKAAKWAAEEYERRTRIIAANEPGINIYWLPPEGRVSWHEIAPKFDLLNTCVKSRLAFQKPFETEMRKRKLIGVLKKRMTAVEWVEKYGNRTPKSTP